MPQFKQVTPEVFTVEDFFTAEECAAQIATSEAIGFADAPITTSFGPQMRPDVRNNSRVMVDDVQQAASLWERATQYVQPWDANWHPIGLNERLRYYRYEIGQQFNWHYDGCYERANGERSWLTFLVYLHDGFEGGQTSFDRIDVEPKAGMALFFIHQIKHKGQPVTVGCKYVLRTDVMYRYTAS